MGFSGSNLPLSETSITYLSAVWCMNIALVVLVYYGVAWLCTVKAGFTIIDATWVGTASMQI